MRSTDDRKDLKDVKSFKKQQQDIKKLVFCEKRLCCCF